MHLPPDEVAKIAKHRRGVEVRLAALLRESGSSMTVESYKLGIFNGPKEPNFQAYLLEALDIFGCDIDSASDAVVSIIQDSWNYFPHRSMEGRCPAEVLAALKLEESGGASEASR
jgi:hypothetical protein